jgi:RNA polymerase sigma factor (sigma-70 family)
MGRLSERQREMLRRRYESGWSIKQIARELGQSPGAVATNLYRTRNELLLCIQKNLDEEE